MLKCFTLECLNISQIMAKAVMQTLSHLSAESGTNYFSKEQQQMRTRCCAELSVLVHCDIQLSSPTQEIAPWRTAQVVGLSWCDMKE